jgi:hypothetical protein
MRVARNVFECLCQGVGALLNLVDPVGCRAGFGRDWEHPIVEQFTGESHRCWQGQQGCLNRVMIDRYHKNNFPVVMFTFGHLTAAVEACSTFFAGPGSL